MSPCPHQAPLAVTPLRPCLSGHVGYWGPRVLGDIWGFGGDVSACPARSPMGPASLLSAPSPPLPWYPPAGHAAPRVLAVVDVVCRLAPGPTIVLGLPV